jgi:hypothetical protein
LVKPLLLLTIVAALTLGLAAHAAADVGTLQIHCRANISERAAVDPLEFYGVKPSPHNHTPAGAMAFSSTSTVRQMMAAPTNCDERADHSMLWVPTPLRPDGKPATITTFDYYLVNLGYQVGKAPPDGLRFVAGDPHCTGHLCSVIYMCRQSNGRILSQHTIPSRVDGCDTSHGHGYGMVLYSAGQCWDGKSLGPGMGSSGPAANITAARPCHGRVIPRILLGLDVGADGLGGYLSSDMHAGTTKTSPGSTAHFDYVFGWNRSALTAIIRHCLNTARFSPGQASCAEVTSREGSTVYEVASGFRLGQCVTGPSCRTERRALRRRSQRAGTAPENGVFARRDGSWASLSSPPTDVALVSPHRDAHGV